MASIPCILTESRRGRMKGSKNRRTLEQLLNLTEIATITATAESAKPVPQACQHPIPISATKNAVTTSNPGPSPDNEILEAHVSGIMTPLDPHNLMARFDENCHGNSRRLTRKFLHSLGEQFPIMEEAESVNQSKTQVGPQDPLPSITHLARRGWDLGEGDTKRVRRVTALPMTHLPPEDARLMKKWTPQALQEAIGETTRYFEYGLAGSKRDVAQDLDPLQRGMISEARAAELFDAFWKLVHPQWAMLDPAIHTLDFVRTRSALLTTSVLALGSTAIATLDQRTDKQVAEAIQLHAHAEKLNLVAYSTGARSIEIVQALILLSRFGLSSRTRLDEQRWIRSALIPRLAAEIGMPFPGRSEVGMPANNETETGRWSDRSTRAFMVLNEYRFFAFSGRSPMNLAQFELTKIEVDEIARFNANSPSSSLPALYELYLFQREVDRRLACEYHGPQSGLRLEADINWVTSYIKSWIARWCSESVPSRKTWHLHHDALSCMLLLYSRFVRKLPHSADRAQYQHRMLDTSLHIFHIALETSHALHMTHRASIFPFAATIILRYSDCRDLVLRLALRMAGEPGRPYVPTFVRNAGNQLLAMLCANQTRPKPQLQQKTERESSKTSECRCSQGHTRPGKVMPAATESDLYSHVDKAENWDESSKRQDEEKIINGCDELLQQEGHEMDVQMLSEIAASSVEMVSGIPSAIELAVGLNTEQGLSGNINGALCGLDFGFEFPYIPSSMEPQVPFLTGQDNSPDIDMLLSLGSLISPEQMTESSVAGQGLPDQLELEWQSLYLDMGSSNAWMDST